MSLNTASRGWSLNRAGVESVNVSLFKTSVSLNETLNGEEARGGLPEGIQAKLTELESKSESFL